MADQVAKVDGSITSYCIEPAETQKSKCAACEKVIPHKSLRVAEVYRSSKKVKKDKARHTWFHFRCWKGNIKDRIQKCISTNKIIQSLII